MSLSYRVTFLCNGCSKLIIHQKVLYDTFFIKKLVKWCLSNTIDRKYTVKLLLSMRAYTFRYNQARQSAANRVDEFDRDVITKETIPPLEEIISKRFDVMMENIEEFSEMGNQKTWETAKTELLKVINELDFNFGELITGLTHNNISRSMKIFLRILSNSRWFAIQEDNENYPGGVIKISANNYEYYHTTLQLMPTATLMPKQLFQYLCKDT